MNIQGLVTLGLTVSVFLAVLGIGIRVAPEDLYSLLRQPKRLIRSLLAMYVLAPMIAVLVCRSFSLHPAVIVALVTLTIAPVGALFSQALLPLVAPRQAACERDRSCPVQALAQAQAYGEPCVHRASSHRPALTSDAAATLSSRVGLGPRSN